MVQIGFTVPKDDMFVNHTYLSGTTRSLRNHFNHVSKNAISKIQLQKDDLVVDIGGNDGTYLEYFRDAGYNVFNIDSGQLQAEKCEEKGIPCLNQFFSRETALKFVEEKGKASIIHASGILFHLEELHSAFAGIKALLKDGGLLVAEFIYLVEMVKNCAYDQIYHEHLIYYTLHSFQYLLEQFGLEVIDAEVDPIHGGSCIAYVAHKGQHQKLESVQQLLRYEQKNAYHTIAPYIGMRDRALQNRETLRTLVASLKKKGKSIQALGAPVKGSTIINFCQLTDDDIDCGIEINPYKCNTYFPSTRIPVYAQDETPVPDVYLLLAWNFKEEILPKLAQFRENGGRILLPIPEPTLI